MMGRLKRLKLFSIFTCLLIFILSIGFSLLAPPQTSMAASGTCPVGFTFQNGALGGPGTCILKNPTPVNGTCPAGFQDVGGGFGTPDTCQYVGPTPVNGKCPTGFTFDGTFGAQSCKFNSPSPKNGKCPSGWTFQTGAFGGAGSCLLNATPTTTGSAPTTCPSGYTLVGSGSSATCQPNGPASQTDCPAGTTFQAATSTSVSSCKVDASAPTSDPCEASGWSLSWIVCPIINVVRGAENALFGIVQGLLKTPPVAFSGADCSNKSATDSSSACIYNVWTNFRDIADVLLVLALLAVVFAETAGGGLIDAYTAKKMLPRILVAAILINLSIYIVATLEDITNVLGGGLYTLISAPFANHGSWGITLNGFGGDLLGFLVGAGGVAFFAAAGAVSGFLALFVGLPVLLAAFGVLVTLMLRQGILVFLIMISPVAFALYVLPNTEQLFRRWWDLLFKTLMVYPIVILVFVMADISGQIISSLAVTPQWLAQIMGVLATVAPLFLIPFAFRMAGGAMGAIAGQVSNIGKRAVEGVKGNPNNPMSNRNKAKRGVANKYIARGTDAQAYLRRKSKEGGGFGPVRRRLATAAMWAAPDLDRFRKDQNEIFDKEISGKVAMGADNLERAFFARQWTGPDTTLENGQTLRTGRWYSTYRGSDGRFGEHSAGDVARAHRSYDGDESKIQTLIKYETGKVANDEDFYGVDENGQTIYDPALLSRPVEEGGIDRTRMPLGSFMSNLPTVMSQAGLSNSSAGGAAIGSFFATQQQRKELKHTKLGADWTWSQDPHAYVQDWAENMGTYAAQTSKTSPIRRLASIQRELTAKQQRIAAGTPNPETGQAEVWTESDQRSSQDLQNIAEGLRVRMSSGQIGTVTEDGPLGAGQGPARVNEAITDLVRAVGLPENGDAPAARTQPQQPTQPQEPEGPRLITPDSPNFRGPGPGDLPRR